jgi:hypothetical protein
VRNGDDSDAELQAALQESLNDMRQTSSSTSSNNPHLTSEEIRQQRLRRFQN